MSCVYKEMFCKYKDMFGKPGEGAHATRIANIAIIDVALTILMGWIIGYIFNLNKVFVIVIAFMIGIIAHRLFCVRTQIDKLLFEK